MHPLVFVFICAFALSFPLTPLFRNLFRRAGLGDCPDRRVRLRERGIRIRGGERQAVRPELG
jgi:UDP-N-acetylmuramyl pentapeptide phosphotransferase/UDP-N-acetylglucosamine-1-phosphate transferase